MKLAKNVTCGVPISAENFQRIRAPWISETSGVQPYMVRIPPSQRWRRVYLHSSQQAINGRTYGYYVRTKDESHLWLDIPPELRT